MFELAWPWAFAALALPFLIGRIGKSATTRASGALHTPYSADLSALPAPKLGRQNRLRLWLVALAWTALVAAAARPQWAGDIVEIPVTGRDLLMAIDLSGSMETQDMRMAEDALPIARIAVVKELGQRFIEGRVGDRVGVILFATRPYLYVPLTFDRKAAAELLRIASLGIAGNRTALGDAIGLAVKRLRTRDAAKRVMVLFTDGANTTGELQPEEAIRLAQRYSVKVYVIGVGSRIASRGTTEDFKFDEAQLKQIASETGGQYFFAEDADSLQGVYDVLDTVEPTARRSQTIRPRTELFYWPLGVAFCIALFLLMERDWRRLIPVSRQRAASDEREAQWANSTS